MHSLQKIPCYVFVFLTMASLCACAMSTGNPENQNPQSLKMLTGPNGIMNGSVAQTDAGDYSLYNNSDGSINILYTDFSQRRCIYLCQQPNCTHDNEACTSWLSTQGGGTGIFAGEDKIYLLQFEDLKTEQPCKILEFDFDGNNRKEIVALDAAQTIISAIVSDEKCFYFFLSEILTSGDAPHNETLLAQLDMETKSIKVLDSLPGDAVYIMGAENRDLFLKTRNGKDVTLSRYNVDDKTYTEIQVLPASASQEQKLYGHQLIYYDFEKNDLVSLDLYKGELNTLVSEVWSIKTIDSTYLSEIWDDHLIVSRNATDPIVVDLKSKKTNPYTLSWGTNDMLMPVTICGETSEEFYVVTGMRNLEFQYRDLEGNLQTGLENRYVYSMISKRDYWENRPNYIPVEDCL